MTIAELIVEAKERACPEANVLPMATAHELEAMADDIREQGLLDAVVFEDGLILDGRNRWVACQLAGVEADAVEWDGQGSRMAYVLSKNLHRRHLDAGQKAAAAAEAMPFFETERKKTQGTRTDLAPTDISATLRGSAGKASADVAAQFDVSPRYVEEAKRLKEEAPAIFTALKTGEATMPQARALSQHPEAVARAESGEATVRDLLSEGLYLPPAKKPRQHEAVYALLKLHGYTDVSAADLAAAALEIADITHEPRLYDVHLEQLRQTAAWLTEAAETMASRMSGARLRVVG
jgi:hypothetical protein